MKVFLFIMMLIVCIWPQSITCYSDSSYYAQIINPSTYLYRDEGKTVIFELPQTYFVEIISYKNGFYTARYNGIKGYVKSNQVKPIKGVPKKVFLTDATFRLFATDYNKLKTSPSILAFDIITLPINVPINYIGSIFSEELIPGRGNTWYYCWYKTDQIYTGYVYAGLCDSLEIDYNTEIVEYMTNPFLSVSTEYIEYLNSSQGKKDMLIPIAIISISFIPLLFAPYIIAKTVKGKRKPSSIFSIEDGKV